MTKAGFIYKTDYLQQKQAMQALAGLLSTVFEIDISLLDAYGGFDPALIPFSYFDEQNRCIANVSIFTMPMMWNGKTIKAHGIQSIAVLPQWRGKGLFADLFTRALQYCGSQDSDLQLLYTENPALYGRRGFCTLAEQASVADHCAAPAYKTPARLLDIRNSADLALIQGLLARRDPVSATCSVCTHAQMFVFNLLHDTDKKLVYAESLQTLLVCAEESGRIIIDDIVSPLLPSWADILSMLPVQAAEIRLHFPADKVLAHKVAIPLARNMALMVRAPAGYAMPEQACLPDVASF